MAFDQTTRNRLQKFVSDARELLVKEFTRQLQNDYGMDPITGEVSDLESLRHLDDSNRETARILRDTLEHYLSGSAQDLKDTLERIVREQAFTVLNRLCAIRMAESRGILIETVGNGYNSKGFQLYKRLAGSALGETGEAYRSYLFTIFDEFSLDLAVLFDRFSSQGRLFPRETVLLELLALINDSDITLLWVEDETIGWIYQYFNSIEERRQMRSESPRAPRNNRELAIRNQFFTPRYVVEFLTDNSLGRLWYEMTQGKTSLINECKYLIHRSEEIFLKQEQPVNSYEGIPQDELDGEQYLSQQYIPFRRIKDPRDIRMLDPACGSMHFGLYAFDLFEKIYEEAWELEEELGPEMFTRSQGLKSLTDSYDSKFELIRDIPRLIIEHNIHGVDIDPRAVQIAGLSLWLRAQRSWQTRNIKVKDRPQIRKSNVVCAEPMPGEKEILREFTEQLRPRVLGQLLEIIFNKMQQVGEVGSLLRIETEIMEAVTMAREEFERELLRRKEEQLDFFPELLPERQMDVFDFSDLPDETEFWDDVEKEFLKALHSYAEHVETLDATRTRLFTQDIVKGFAFINLFRKQYDVILMNPPFGEPSEGSFDYITTNYNNINKNLLCAFLQRAKEVGTGSHFVGAIYDRTAIEKKLYENFRRDFFLRENQLYTQGDLGWGVLDANVEVTSSVFRYSNIGQPALFIDARKVEVNEKDNFIINEIQNIRNGVLGNYSICNTQEFTRFPNAVLGYDFPDYALKAFFNFNSFQVEGGQVFQGHTIKSDTFFRYWWEVPLDQAFKEGASWQRLYNGGEYTRFVSPLSDAVYYGESGNKIESHSSTIFRNLQLQQKGKVGFGKRGDFIDAHILPEGFVSTVEGQAIIIQPDVSPFTILAVLNSQLFQAVINLYCGQHKYAGYVNIFPLPPSDDMYIKQASLIAEEIFKIKDLIQATEEISPKFGCKQIPAVWSIESLNDIIPMIERVNNLELKMNSKIFEAYKLSIEDIEKVKSLCVNEPDTGYWFDNNLETNWISAFLSYFLGACFGRWDIQYALGKKNSFELSDPLEKLPVCPPGMLTNKEGLPLKTYDSPEGYPFEISLNGILVDDEGHIEDIIRRIRQAIEIVYRVKSEEIEQKICEKLNLNSLREYFQKPYNFFTFHLNQYTKGRSRQAPIYWPISSASGSYTLWLYYYRVTDQTLFTCINDYLEPKIELVKKNVNHLLGKQVRSKAEEKELERLTDLENELNDFRDELLRVAAIWKPNLNDGVQITAAPLWKFINHTTWKNKLKDTWENLEKGEHDWSHLAYSIWPDRVRKKCKTDKSLAIAHLLEELYEEKPSKKKKKNS